jgi:1-acyl-sn-glycerol-3-phosphate acyltransferase
MLLDAEVAGVDNLRGALGEGPCLLIGNHVSYADTQLTDALLHPSAASIADGLVAVAGPKVYETPFRRLATIALNTLKTAQSTGLAQNDASLSPKAVTRIALSTIREVAALTTAGRAVILYAEGTRTRTGRLCSFLRGVTRYFRIEGLRIVPMALAGSDEFFPLGEKAVHPAGVRLAFGEALRPDEWGEAGALEETWRRVAAMLPERQRPAPDVPPIV